MKTKFEMTNIGLMKYFLGIEVDQSSQDIFVSQQKYARDHLKIFQMDICKPTKTRIVLGRK
jgi:hypothetical protein